MDSLFYYVYTFIPRNESDDVDDAFKLYEIEGRNRRPNLDAFFNISNTEARECALATYITAIVKTSHIRRNSYVDLRARFSKLGGATLENARAILEHFDDAYDKALYDPNTCIGIIASTSVSESSTQNVLNAFHYSGTTSGAQCAMSVGLPRILEILSIADKPKTSGAAVVKKNNTNLRFQMTNANSRSMDLRDLYRRAYKLEHKTIGTLLRRYSIYYGANPANHWIPLFRNSISNCSSKFIPYTIDLDFDVYAMYKCGVRLVDLCNIIQRTFFDIYCVFSPEKYGVITLYFVETDTNEDIENIQEYARFVLSHIYGLNVCGINGIKAVYPSKNDNTFIVDTEGGGLLDAMIHPDVIGKSVISNNVYETFTVLGIEACRALFILELKKTFAHSGIAVNEQHLEILIDVMTNSGAPKPVSRYGVETDSFIAQACFEQSLGMLLSAGINNKTDNLRGAAASVMMGEPICTGSGRNIELYGRPPK